MSRKAGTNLVTHDLPLHGHTETCERAVSDGPGDDGLTALCLAELVGLDLAAIEGLRGEESDVAVPSRDDSQQLLLGDQVDVVHFLIVAHPNDF